MATIITRASWCEACQKAHRPFRGIPFIVYGTHRGAYYAREAMRNGIRGFTPHTFILEQVSRDGFCKVSMACGVYGCSVETTYKDGRRIYLFKKEAWQTIYLKIADWNALLQNHRDPQYLI